jgi:hypothetical protein
MLATNSGRPSTFQYFDRRSISFNSPWSMGPLIENWSVLQTSMWQIGLLVKPLLSPPSASAA